MKLLRTQAEMLEAYRERIRELGLTHATVDALSGLPDGYTSKLMSPTPMKNLGPKSVELLNGALAMGFVVAVDEEQARRVEKRWIRRRRPIRILTASIPASIDNECPKTLAISPRLNLLIAGTDTARQFATSGARARALKLSPRKRKLIARRAATARWSKPRVSA